MKNVLFLWLIRVFVIVCAICLPATGLMHAQEVLYGDTVTIYVKDANDSAQYLGVNESGELELFSGAADAVAFVIRGGEDGAHIQPNDNVELEPVGVTIEAAPGNVLRGPISMLLSGGLYYDELFMFQELVNLSGQDVFYMERVE
ncbi:MAG: hypothetical protein H6679_04295 [Epsilonproteobacteria bacterium]|nr:hypothetical protein [Campylobacterota bacterium]